MMALDLGVNQSIRTVCPFCNAAHETSFTLNRTEDGIQYGCWRAKCGKRGFIPSKAMQYDPHWHKKEPKKRKPKTFSYDTVELPDELVEMFYVRYSITKDELIQNGFSYAPELDRVIMPIYNYLGYEIGQVARSYDPDITGSKAINYFSDGKSHLHYVPQGMYRNGAIVCVEDIPSSLRCARFGRAIAILGSYISHENILELAEHTGEVIIALDPDATNKAFKMRNKYRAYFRNFSIRVLSKDPKDMSDEEIQNEIFN